MNLNFWWENFYIVLGELKNLTSERCIFLLKNVFIKTLVSVISCGLQRDSITKTVTEYYICIFMIWIFKWHLQLRWNGNYKENIGPLTGETRTTSKYHLSCYLNQSLLKIFIYNEICDGYQVAASHCCGLLSHWLFCRPSFSGRGLFMWSILLRR